MPGYGERGTAAHPSSDVDVRYEPVTVHVRRRRDSITAVEVIEWFRALGWEASIADVERALDHLTQ